MYNESVVIKGIQIAGLDFMKSDSKSMTMISVQIKTIEKIMPSIKLDI